MPAADRQLSTFITTGLPDEDVWDIADKAIVGRPTNGRGDLGTGPVLAEGLEIVRDDDPPRHANVTGWPTDKAAQKEIAQALAAAASLRLR